jgi:hypothetical protein
MPRDDVHKAYEILELPADAPLRDVHNAYMHLKNLYSGEYIVLAPLGEEFSDKKKKKVLEQIEEAYAKILAARKIEATRTAPLFRDEPAANASRELENLDHASFSGPLLRKVREMKKIDLSEISKELKLRVELLRAIEDERFDALPEAIYLKSQLKTYAAFLRLNPVRVADDYLQRHRAWKGKSGKPAD